MKDVTGALVGAVLESRPEDVGEETLREARRALVNYMGCALGGADHPAMDITLRALGPFCIFKKEYLRLNFLSK